GRGRGGSGGGGCCGEGASAGFDSGPVFQETDAEGGGGGGGVVPEEAAVARGHCGSGVDGDQAMRSPEDRHAKGSTPPPRRAVQ
ncbi:unnamed protein product, partial [Laminaria digitata]